MRVAGPAIITEYSSTTLVASGWTAEVAADASLLLTRPSKGNGKGRAKR